MRTLALLGVLAALLGGCASYQMGVTADLPYQSISVAPTRNQSDLPQLEAPLNGALRQALLSSDELSLATGAQADAILEVTVLTVSREIAAVSPSDVGRGRKFALVATVEVNLQPASSSESYYIQGRALTVTQEIFTDGGQVDAEYQAVPELSRKIATRTYELLVDLW